MVVPLILMSIKRLRTYMKEKLKGILSNYFFTGYIVAQNVSYLKGLLIIAVTLINLIGGNENEFNYLTII